MMGSHDMAFNILRGATLAAAAFATISWGVVYVKLSTVPAGSSLRQAADLDGNGVQDIIRETQTGSKVPYFGVRLLPSGDVAYFPAGEMSQRFPENRDLYSGIEAGLNKK